MIEASIIFAAWSLLTQSQCSAEMLIRPDVTSMLRLKDLGEDSAGTTVSVTPLSADQLLITGSAMGASQLQLSGSSTSYRFEESASGQLLVLEACNLSNSALAMVVDGEYFEWVGEGFFQARPDIIGIPIETQTSAFESVALDAQREVYWFVPDDWDGASGDPVIVSGDGLAASSFVQIAEALRESGAIRPVAFVSARFGEGWVSDAQRALRSVEYVSPSNPGDSAARRLYRAHEDFFFEEWLSQALMQIGGGETGPIYLFGISASATFALEQGLKRPHQVDAIIAASPAITSTLRDRMAVPPSRQHVHIWCGAFEPLFCDPVLTMSDAEGVVVRVLQGTHSNALWEEAFAQSLTELAAADPAPRR